jgi:putative peptidoglycan lipid II flippase
MRSGLGRGAWSQPADHCGAHRRIGFRVVSGWSATGPDWRSEQGAASLKSRTLAAVLALFPRGALLPVLTFGGYLLGLARDRAFARTFGAGADLDAYNAALVLPELTLNILVVAGLTAAFVPVFTGSRRDDPEAADAFSRTVLTTSILIMAIAVAVLFAIAPATVDFVAPGFDAHQRDLYTQLFRLMCLSSLVFSGSFALGEMLVARQRFLSYGLAPVLYNLGIVLGTIILSSRIGIYGAAVGTLVGAFLHLGVRVVGARRMEMRFRPELGLRSAAFREYLRLSLPKMFSQPIEPLTFLFFTSVASTLVAGSVSALSFARNFQSVPVSLIGVAFSVAAFPVLAAAAAAGDRPRYIRLVTTNLATITLATTAAALLLYVVAGTVVRVFLGGEAFDAEDVRTTSLVIGAFTLSIPLESVTHLLSRAIYATHNTLMPVAASIAGLIATVGTVELLVPTSGIVALPLGFTAGQGVKVLILAAALVIRTRTVGAAGGRPKESPLPAEQGL